jgi:CBS domain containing-hemolysin-like protein
VSAPFVILVATVALIALSAFFVAAEFALLAARPHRFEDRAATSRSARAALRSSSELTVLLAGCQLGITACALGLGAVTKPAVHHWLTPLMEDWGVRLWVADVAGFVLALLVVTFLHLVVGEMAPKSWAISHPESSAMLLAIPMRGFMALTRPLLRSLNESANWLLRRVGVEPTAQIATGQSADDLRHLVEHSANVGALDASFSAQLSGALDLQRLTVRDLVRPGKVPTAVGRDATLADVRRATRSSGHLRILVGERDRLDAVIHVRDTIDEPGERPAADLARPVLTLDAAMPVYSALATMRESRNHLAVVTSGGRAVGVITLADVLQKLFPRTATEPAGEAA